jgi:hypothetical protein
MTEAWLAGPVAGVDPLLMPVAHALIQARGDIVGAANGLSEPEIWIKPGGAASVGFHMLHVPGAIDRLLTYARGVQQLSDEQRTSLDRERVAGEFAWHPAGGAAPGDPPERLATLIALVESEIDRVLDVVRATKPRALTEPRLVGRAGLPSTVGGLLFHIAEHTQRHTGQIITTAKIVRGLRLGAR